MPSALPAAPLPRGRWLGSPRVPTCGTLFRASYPAVLEQPSYLERQGDQLWRTASNNFAMPTGFAISIGFAMSKSFAVARCGGTER
jgi:hypothetical protein